MPICGGSSNNKKNRKVNEIISRKLVVIGDGACGKTSLLSVFTRDYFPQVQSKHFTEINAVHIISHTEQPRQKNDRYMNQLYSRIMYKKSQ